MRTRARPLERPPQLAADCRVEVELGCADAEFSFQLAAARPDWLVAGVEIREPCLVRNRVRAQELGLGNLVFAYSNLNVDLDRVFAPRSVDRFHLLFPDPYPSRAAWCAARASACCGRRTKPRRPTRRCAGSSCGRWRTSAAQARRSSTRQSWRSTASRTRTTSARSCGARLRWILGATDAAHPEAPRTLGGVLLRMPSARGSHRAPRACRSLRGAREAIRPLRGEKLDARWLRLASRRRGRRGGRRVCTRSRCRPRAERRGGRHVSARLGDRGARTSPRSCREHSRSRRRERRATCARRPCSPASRHSSAS